MDWLELEIAVAEADLDNEDSSATQAQLGYIESLLQSPSVNVDDKYIQNIESEMETSSQAAAKECIDYLLSCQVEGVRMTGTGQAKSTLKASIEEAVENPKT